MVAQADENLLRYYKELFPYGPYYTWLANPQAGQESKFPYREFSIVLENDIYIRYKSYEGMAEMVDDFIKNAPSRIDIGAVFNLKPKTSKSVLPGSLAPVKKEFVLDIDMTDYDEFRTCCKEASICAKCWRFIELAVELIDAVLKNHFGFQRRLWVYSGRRGVHCWVSDLAALKLTSEQRGAMMDYLSLVKGGSMEQSAKKVYLTKRDRLHPLIGHSRAICEKYFEEIVEKQHLMMHPRLLRVVLSFLNEPGLQTTAAQKLKETFPLFESTAEAANNEYAARRAKYGIDALERESLQRWQTFKTLVTTDTRLSALKGIITEIVIQFCYPRLDVNVSKGLNHLLKSPFCIHPKTGRVCVPIDPQNLQHFDPAAVPTLKGLLSELDQQNFTHSNDNDDNDTTPPSMKTDESPLPPATQALLARIRHNLAHTSLHPYVQYFTRMIESPSTPQ